MPAETKLSTAGSKTEEEEEEKKKKMEYEYGSTVGVVKSARLQHAGGNEIVHRRVEDVEIIVVARNIHVDRLRDARRGT